MFCMAAGVESLHALLRSTRGPVRAAASFPDTDVDTPGPRTSRSTGVRNRPCLGKDRDRQRPAALAMDEDQLVDYRNIPVASFVHRQLERRQHQ